jgi:hypothetical protein
VEETMSTNHLKLIRAIFFSVFLCVLACVGIGLLSNRLEEGSSQAPVKSLRVSIDKSQRQELFDQLRKFADKHAFEYSLTDYGGQGKYFLVYILGNNIEILAVETSRNSDVFAIRFYAR